MARHKKHIPESLAKAPATAEVASAEEPIDRVRSLVDRSGRLLAEAEAILGEGRQSRGARIAVANINAAAIAGQELGNTSGYLVSYRAS